MPRVCSIFTITSDFEDAKSVLETMGVNGSRVYKNKPMNCPVCSDTRLVELEVIGLGDEPLFWECDKCGALHLAKDRGWIEGEIKKFKDCWTNARDWETPPKEDFI